MPWAKLSDTSATHPRVMKLDTLEDAEDHTLNEVFGFILRAAVQSAQHLTDYRLEASTARMLAPDRWELLVAQAQKVGLLGRTNGRDRARWWAILQDDDLIHIRLRDEVEWERRRDKDRKNPALTMPARARWGDACAYCRHVVNWSDHRGGRGGTMDHRAPGKAATVDSYVVSCRSCNSQRGRNPDLFDQFNPISGPPEEPYFHPSTVKLLARHGYAVKPGSKPQPREIRRVPDGNPPEIVPDSPETHQGSTSPEGGIPVGSGHGSGLGSGRVDARGSGPKGETPDASS